MCKIFLLLAVMAGGFEAHGQQLQAAPASRTRVQAPMQAVQRRAEVFGQIGGTVVDPAGAVIAGVTIMATNLSTNALYQAKSDATGSFALTGLPAGTYAVALSFPGFVTRAVENVAVLPMQTKSLRVTMQRLPLEMQLAVPKNGAMAAAPAAPPKPVVPSAVEMAKPTAAPAAPLNPVGAGVVEMEKRSPASDSPSKEPSADIQKTTGELASEWYNKLPKGRMEVQAQPVMILNEAASVSVVIHGDKTAAAQATTGGPNSKPLRVSDWMQVELSWPDNPNDFEMVSKADNPQFVPRDLDTTWTWTVKPLRSGTAKLQAKAFVLYPGTPNGIPMALESANEIVSVKAETLGQRGHDLYDGFQRDPLKWVHYYLPGGGGFAIIAGLIAWWKKQRKPSSKRGGKAEGAKTPQGGDS